MKTLVASLCLPELCTEIDPLYLKGSLYPNGLSLSIPFHLPMSFSQAVFICTRWTRQQCALGRWEIHFFITSINQIPTPFLSCGSSRYSAGSVQLPGIKSICNGLHYSIFPHDAQFILIKSTTGYHSVFCFISGEIDLGNHCLTCQNFCSLEEVFWMLLSEHIGVIPWLIALFLGVHLRPFFFINFFRWLWHKKEN